MYVRIHIRAFYLYVCSEVTVYILSQGCTREIEQLLLAKHNSVTWLAHQVSSVTVTFTESCSPSIFTVTVQLQCLAVHDVRTC